VFLQDGFTLGEDLFIRITDNASTDSTVSIAQSLCNRDGVSLFINKDNLGFSAAHNQGAALCVESEFDAMLVLNPDVGLSPQCLYTMARELAPHDRIGMVSPKLLRARSDLGPIIPPVLDAAGMILTPALRHFDRGSGEVDRGQFETPEVVFGGTGACLLIATECIKSVSIPKRISDAAVWEIYPQLGIDSQARLQLFDEAFFAYREDADLAWRSLRLGWRCVYEPHAHAFHVRVVTPERRSILPAHLNRLGVRNRFLLQLNNWDLSHGGMSLISGVLWRNVLVVVAVLVRERESLPALFDVVRLWTRARAIYRSTEKA
jgi:GT2 family glycosyltransferase